MKILMLCGEIPYPPHGGSRMRVYQFIRALSDRHHITLLAYQYSNDECSNIESLKEWCRVETVQWKEPRALILMRSGNAITSQLAYAGALLDHEPFVAQYFRSDVMSARARELLRSERFDILHVEDSAMMTVVPTDVRPPIVLSLQNVEYWRARRTPPRNIADRIERAKLTRFERHVFMRAAVCCTTSDLEAEQVRRLVPYARVQVVANGVDARAFAPRDEKAPEPTIVFTGTLSYAPNADGIRWFAREVWPLVQREVPGVRLQIVGREPPDEVWALATENIVVTGEVRDVLPYLQRAWLAIAPILAGGGTRLKILEGLACALPVISTTIGAEGLSVVANENILIADDAPSFARALTCLLHDPSLRASLGTAGRALVERKYHWHAITQTLEQAYGNVIRDS